MRRRWRNMDTLAFEETVGEVEGRHTEIVEVPLGTRPLLYVWFLVLALTVIFLFRIVSLVWGKGVIYTSRAKANVEQIKKTSPLRGIITDRYGKVLAENSIAPYVFLETGEFLKHQELQQPTLDALYAIAGITPEEVWQWIADSDPDRLGERFPIPIDINDRMLVMLKGLSLPTIVVEDGIERIYKGGIAFSQILGYVGFPTASDLRSNPTLSSEEMIGKDGVERSYNAILRGDAGLTVTKQDVSGRILESTQTRAPSPGQMLKLSIDADLQTYFYNRLVTQLRAVNRTVGVGIAMNSKTGEILSLIQEPTYDNTILSSSGHSAEKRTILNSPTKPLFDRAVSGAYSPGSTIKPLVGIAALKEGIIDTTRQIFSPGYINIPNPFDPSKPTRYKDWRYQGWVNLAKAIAYSSDVYFYEIGGGAPGGSKGLGIDRLNLWWQKFGLGSLTGIDLPGEVNGFLPTIQWKESRDNRPWLLGDTYNVSIGQGDLLLTPIQLLTYMNTIATKGKLLEPTVTLNSDHPKVVKDLSELAPEMQEVEKGMELAITDPNATIYTLHNLPFTVAAKTGSAQFYNNRKVNAFFLGYAPVEDPQIIVLVLIEDAKEGSLNTIPVGGDVLNWYYQHRIQNKPSVTTSTQQVP